MDSKAGCVAICKLCSKGMMLQLQSMDIRNNAGLSDLAHTALVPCPRYTSQWTDQEYI
jgi:hypothetical protein